MGTENLTVRPARPKDASFIAQVVCMALGSDERHPMFAVFGELAGRELAQYSFRNTLVAEVDGAAAGAIVGYDGARLKELREPIFALLREHLGRTIEIEEETTAGEFYLDSVAVLPSFQGLGIGRILLETMLNKAYAEGFERVGLLVDVDNPRAEALYTSIGFERINPTTFLGHKMWHLQAKK